MNWGDRLGDLRWGGLVAYDGWTYGFNAEDAMWAVKMLVGEAGGAADGQEGDAILWSMANRLYLLRAQTFTRRDGLVLNPPHNYTQMIRAYSQPINPAWLDPRLESDASRLERRRQILSLQPNSTWRGMPVENVTRKVVAFMQGKIPNIYPGVVHFGEAGREEFVERHGTPATMPFVAKNWFWKSPATRMWNIETLQSSPPGEQSIVAPVLVGVGAFVVYLLLVKLTGSKTLGLLG